MRSPGPGSYPGTAPALHLSGDTFEENWIEIYDTGIARVVPTTGERNTGLRAHQWSSATATALLDMTSLLPHLSPFSPPAFQPRTRPWADGQMDRLHIWASVITLTYDHSYHQYQYGNNGCSQEPKTTVVACSSSGRSLNPQAPNPRQSPRGPPPPPAPRTDHRISIFGNPSIHLTVLRPLTSLHWKVRRHCTLTRQFGFFYSPVCAVNHVQAAMCVWFARHAGYKSSLRPRARGLVSKLTQHFGSAASLSLLYRHLPLPQDFGSLLWKPEAVIIPRRHS